MSRVGTDAPLQAYDPPEQQRRAVKAAGLALFQLTTMFDRLQDDDERESVARALLVLPGSMYDEPPATATDWKQRVTEAANHVSGIVRIEEPGDLPSSLLRIAHESLRSAAAALDERSKDAALRPVAALHMAVYAALMADGLDGRMKEALVDIRGILAAALD